MRSGINGKIAVTYFEWAYDQKIVMPWRVIDGPETAAAVTKEIAAAPYRRAPRTSIYGALQFAQPLFDTSGYHGLRRIIDVSGDGTNNYGPPVTLMRDQVVDAGITINGLPIMLKRPYGSGTDIANLDVYYEDCVIGGPRRVCHRDPRARAVQGGDPHQIGAGDRGSDAATAGDSSPSDATAAGLLPLKNARRAIRVEPDPDRNRIGAEVSPAGYSSRSPAWEILARRRIISATA